MPTLRVIGAGRAGSSFEGALGAAGWAVLPSLHHGDDLRAAAAGCDLLVLAVPDHAIAEVAGRVEPVPTTVVAHLAGSLGSDVLGRHPRRAAIHPVVALPDAASGAARLRGAWFAVAGDPLAVEVVDALGGRAFPLADEHRAAHHAACAMAANHLTALLGVVERVAGRAGLPLAPYVDLAAGAVATVAERGPAAALTGPVARRDWATVDAHLAALADADRPAYLALAAEAARLAGHGLPAASGLALDTTVVDEKAALRLALDQARAAGLTVGLVPTMGALHEGHATLIRRAAAECDVVAVTIFVNPLQFDRAEDLAAYPRSLDADLAVAAAAGASVVLAPTAMEVFGPDGVRARIHVDGLADRLEGESRPGHFDGVATVCTKLFGIAGPCRAYFGEKDFQQVAVVRRLVHDLDLPVDVVACPIVRAGDGLALSSRNALLSPDERVVAPGLFRALQAGARLVADGGPSPDAVAAAVRRSLAAEPAGSGGRAEPAGSGGRAEPAGSGGRTEPAGEPAGSGGKAEPRFRLDRVDVVDAGTLKPPSGATTHIRILAAAFLGQVRLIDNLGAEPAGSGGKAEL